MDWHLLLGVFNSALLLGICGGLVNFHRDWVSLGAKVQELWEERERRLDAEADARALQKMKAFRATNSSD